MDTTRIITKKQKRLIEKYTDKYGKDYLLSYVQEKYPDAVWEDLSKEEAQYLITGRKAHERNLKKKTM